MENSLLDVLKPEVMAEIEKDKEKYPLIVEELLQELKTQNLVINMRYGYVCTLDNYYYRAFKKPPKHAWEMFNIHRDYSLPKTEK